MLLSAASVPRKSGMLRRIFRLKGRSLSALRATTGAERGAMLLPCTWQECGASRLPSPSFALSLCGADGHAGMTRCSSITQVRRFASGSDSAPPPFTVVNMPALSPTMEAGTIVRWVAKEGSELSPGDVLCEVETDKATVSFEVQDDGVLAKVLAPEKGGEVVVGNPVAIMVDDKQAYAAWAAAEEAGSIPSDFAGTPPDASTQPVATSSPVLEAEPESPSRSVAENFLLMPAARLLAETQGIDVTSLHGTGKGGRITKGDVIAALAAGKTFPSLTPKEARAVLPTPAKVGAATASSSGPGTATATAASVPPLISAASVQEADAVLSGEFTDIPNNNIRKVIAKRLTESKAKVPHMYVSTECELDAMLSLRKKMAEDGVKFSVNDVIMRCAALALRDVPEANAQWKGDRAELSSTVDISVAVATPSGLITPIVAGADGLGLTDISATVRDLATRAKDNKLQPHEFQGGTFTISNLGMFGIDEFSAVINPPQACIMAVGAGAKRVLPGIGGAKPRVATVMTARLSCDRRVVDEAIAAQFLQSFRHYMQSPSLLLL